MEQKFKINTLKEFDFSNFWGVHWQERGHLLLLENIGKVKFAMHHRAPYICINRISKARHSTGSHFLEVKGQGYHPPGSPSSLQSASDGNQTPGARAHSPSCLLCSGDARRGSPALEIAALTRIRNFHFLSIPFPVCTLPPESCHVAMISWLTPLALVFTHAAMQAEGSMWDTFRSVMESRTCWAICLSLGASCKIEIF